MAGCQLKPAVAAAPAIIVGNASSRENVTFQNLRVDGSLSQHLFEVRRTRNFRLQDCYGTGLYSLMKWGRIADGLAGASGVMHHRSCEWNMRLGHTHFIHAANTYGVYIEDGVLVQGCDTDPVGSGCAFLYIDPLSFAPRFDTLYLGDGGKQSFDYGVYANEARLVNVETSAACRFDGMRVGDYYLRATVATGPNGCQTGAENISIHGSYAGILARGYLLGIAQAGGSYFGRISVMGVNTSRNRSEAVTVYADPGTSISGLTIDGLNIWEHNPSAAGKAGISLNGRIDLCRVNNVTHERMAGSVNAPVNTLLWQNRGGSNDPQYGVNFSASGLAGAKVNVS